MHHPVSSGHREERACAAHRRRGVQEFRDPTIRHKHDPKLIPERIVKVFTPDSRQSCSHRDRCSQKFH
jgi:hypothetical protein